MKRVMLAGEGSNELGGWADPEWARAGRTMQDQGVLEALLRRVAPDGWEITRSVPWCRIRKLRANRHDNAEAHNVNALLLDAREHNCDVLAFARDRDGDRRRQEAVESALAAHDASAAPAVIGGVAVEKLEAWVLALRGRSGTEQRLHPEKELVSEDIGQKDTAAFVAVVEAADLARLPADATSLRRWLDRAREVLGPSDPVPDRLLPRRLEAAGDGNAGR